MTTYVSYAKLQMKLWCYE